MAIENDTGNILTVDERGWLCCFVQSRITVEQSIYGCYNASIQINKTGLQKYPDEVSAIIGLDMAVPEYYDSMNINMPLLRIASWAANLGVTRFIPGISNSDAVKYGTLTDKEKEIYKAIFYSRTATVTMINETEWVKENAQKVNDMGVPPLPMLLFISDGSGGTGFDEEIWRKIPIEYISQVEGGKYIELDCPHYIQDYEYNAISESIISFLSDQ